MTPLTDPRKIRCHNFRMNRLPLLAAASIALVSGMSAHADVPNLINYQGRLTDKDGAPMNTPVAMEVAVFSQATGGTASFSQNLGQVQVKQGIYSVAFGGETLPPVLQNPECWLELTVNGTILQPRQKLLAVPYALQAKVALHANTTDDIAGQITPNKIAGEAVTKTTQVSGDLAGSWNNLQIQPASVGTAEIADNSVTPAKLAVLPGVCPVGTIMAFAKDYINADNLATCRDKGWALCDGTTPASQGILNAIIATTPNLNGEKRYLKGSTSSGVSTDENYLASHSHDAGSLKFKIYSGTTADLVGSGGSFTGSIAGTTTSAQNGTVPLSYTVVWLMRVK